FTTVMAEDVLIAAGVRREDRKKTVDRQAAQIILQSWLDRQANLAAAAAQTVEENA
ncbi:MAG: RuvX/YqgF family protein, partial [Eubacterium sp.]|nr:RuvX/YqgF family protein [Eubacterium sp.]